MPSNLNLALENISKKLSQKRMHLTFVVLQQDYQLPQDTTSALSSDVQEPCRPSAGTGSHAKVMSGFSLSSIKRKVRGSTSSKAQCLSSNNLIQENLVDMAGVDRLRHNMASPAYSVSSMSTASTMSMASTLDSAVNSPRLAWTDSSDVTCSVPATPATPYSAVSSSTNTLTTEVSSVFHGGLKSQAESSPVGFKLMHIRPPSTTEDKIWRHAVQRTRRKLHLR